MGASHYVSEDGEHKLCIIVTGQSVIDFDWLVLRTEDGTPVKSGREGAKFYPFNSAPIMAQCMEIARNTGIEFVMGYNNSTPCDCD